LLVLLPSSRYEDDATVVESKYGPNGFNSDAVDELLYFCKYNADEEFRLS